MLPRFFTHMDKQAVRAISVVLAMFIIVAVIASIGHSSLNLEDGEYFKWFEAFKQSDWVVPIVLMTFVFGAFIGLPQWALIAGVVAAFGPIVGGVSAWACTMVSASLNFWIARWIGAERVKKFGGDLVNRIIGIVRRNGFLTSFTVRLVPTGPFILVNMAAGVSQMKFLHFFAGTGFGIIPKIAAVALITTGVISGEQNNSIRIGLIALAFVFVAAMLVARKHLGRFTKPS